MFNNFIVITADIIDSKRHSIDSEFLSKSIEKLNKAFENELVAYFKLYRGDEIQCVPLSTKNIMKIIRNFRYALKPLEVRIGIGKGEIDNTRELYNNKLKNSNPWENDGQAFHLARQSLEYLNSNKSLEKKPRTYILSGVNGNDSDVSIGNSLLNLYDMVLESWTKSQWDCIHAYEQYRSLEQAAHHLEKTYQSVQRSVSTACWDEVKVCEEHINQLIKRL